MSWTDRIFDRLTIRYGVRFLNQWKGIDLNAVRSDWADVLSGFENWPESIVFAIEHLDDEKPPTAKMFRAIAMKAPKPESLALPAPDPDPIKMAEEMAKLDAIKSKGNATCDNKEWAKRLKARHDEGGKLNLNQVRCYRLALGMD
jgi:hypothetical protein